MSNLSLPRQHCAHRTWFRVSPFICVAGLLFSCSNNDPASTESSNLGGNAGAISGGSGGGGATAIGGSFNGGNAGTESTAGTGGNAGSDAGVAGNAGTAGASGNGGVGGGGDTSSGPITWPSGKVAAVTLTYDDGLDTHLATVVPALDARGLKGTFFISSFPGVDTDWALPNTTSPLNARQQAWQAVAANGHELAGHTVNHPCTLAVNPGQAPGFLLDKDYDLARITAELDDSIARLKRLGATEPLTFAYPCYSDVLGVGMDGQSYAPAVAARFLAARTSPEGIATAGVDLQHVPIFDTIGKTGDELRAEVDAAIAQGGWVTFLFHGVGEEQLDCGGLAYAPQICMVNYLTTSTDAHTSLVDYLDQKKAQVWTATMKEVALYLKSQSAP